MDEEQEIYALMRNIVPGEKLAALLASSLLETLRSGPKPNELMKAIDFLKEAAATQNTSAGLPDLDGADLSAYSDEQLREFLRRLTAEPEAAPEEAAPEEAAPEPELNAPEPDPPPAPEKSGKPAAKRRQRRPPAPDGEAAT